MYLRTYFSSNIRLLIFTFAVLLLAATVGPMSGGSAAADVEPSAAIWTKMDTSLQQMMAANPGEAIPIIVQKSATDQQAEAIVIRHGGTIRYDLPIINGFAAEAAPPVILALSQSPAVHHISFDGAVVNTAVSQTVAVRISSSADDADEAYDRDMYLDSSDLELVYDGSNQTIGLRFQGVQIPQGATITDAYVEFETDETNSTSTASLNAGLLVADGVVLIILSSDFTFSERS